MRADRLVATLLLLRARGRLTAAQLASELEVSLKTARRDLEALAAAGVPVFSQSGRGGGWSLLDEWRTDLSGLTAAEARALFLIAGPSASASPEAKAALRKLTHALPEAFRQEASAAAGAVVIDPARWGGRVDPTPPLLVVLERAVIQGVQARIVYASRSSTPTERVVHPLGLAQKGSVWYLLAATPRGLRTFRASRIRTVALTTDPVDRPPDFDLPAAWKQVVAQTDSRRRAVRAVVRVDRRQLAALREQFGADLTSELPLDDGRYEVTIHRQSAEILGDELAGWGADLEVIAPVAVRDRLAQIGAELVARYGAR
jgi:predicted DNA-binding transcriptional regulator YafY